jgi:hypothetical protein
MDVDQVLASLLPARIDLLNLSDYELRLVATLKVRLGLFSVGQKCISLLHRRIVTSKREQFRIDFYSAFIHYDREKALRECSVLCQVEFPAIEGVDPDAARLLLGVSDGNDSQMKKDRQIQDISVLPNGKFSLSLMGLLAIIDPNIALYSGGRELFMKSLVLPRNEPDYFSSGPLEAAYVWTLSCQSALNGEIKFKKSTNSNSDAILFKIKCQGLVASRLFQGTNKKSYEGSLKNLSKNFIYYSNEKQKGQASHPLADIFFISDDDELVLVDIAGGSSVFVAEKLRNLITWIAEEQGNIKDRFKYKLRGVVLAPNLETDTHVHLYDEKSHGDCVSLVSGREGIDLLGGLGQIFQWLLPLRIK